jgi:outer membrane protein
MGSAHNSGTAAVSSGGKGVANSAKVGVTLRLPIYTGGAVDNQVKEAVALEEKSRNDLDIARRGVAQATRQVYFGVQSGQAQVLALQAAESSSKLALEATQTGYRVGVRVNLDVLNAQTQLFSTQRDLAKSRYDVLVNGLKLRQAAGVLSVADLDTVNGLLGR